MATTVTCPSCGSTLQVASDDRERWLTCPRCLAQVVNPNVLVTTGAPSPQPEVPEAASQGPFLASPDDDVRRDTTGLRAFLIALALMGGIGIVLFLCGGGLGQTGQGLTLQATLVIGAVLFMLAITGSVVLSFRGSNPAARGIGRVLVGGLVGTLIGAGFAILVCVLLVLAFVALVGAVINSFFETCSKGCH
jgi:hypothetical protein